MIFRTHFLAVLLASLAGSAGLHAAGEPLTRIAAGSCNRQDLPQPLWEPITAFHPQLWIWLGDNIYGDTHKTELLAEKWAAQKNQPGYQRLLASSRVLGVWDDRDYGLDDSGFNHPRKAESQRLFLDFLGEPQDSPRRRQLGIQDAKTFGPEGKKVCVILLDVRSWRPPPRSGGDILGEAQWRWLEKTLRESDAQVHLICSGTQILPTAHRGEKWQDFPDSRRRLLRLLADLKPSGTVLLSGDRQFSELSRLENPDGGPALLEMTPSGLTHVREDAQAEPNEFRVGDPFLQPGFGTVEIDWDTRKLTLSIRDGQGTVVRTATAGF